MAYGDTQTVDGQTYTYAPKTAQQDAWVADYPNEDRLKREDEARAAAAGVTGVDKIDYAEALRNYESRSDIELFANRRAREYGTTFESQDFARSAAQEAGPLQSSTLGSTTVVKGDTAGDGLVVAGDAGDGDETTGGTAGRPGTAPVPARPSA